VDTTRERDLLKEKIELAKKENRKTKSINLKFQPI
jgi:hypothetical protein